MKALRQHAAPFMKRRFIQCIIAVAGLRALAAEHSETNATPRLDLQAVLRLAVERSLDVAISKEKVNEAHGDSLESRAKLLPSLTGVAKQTRQDRSTAQFGLPTHVMVSPPPSLPFNVGYNASDKLVQRLGLPTSGSVTFPDQFGLGLHFADETGENNFFDGHLGLEVPLVNLQNLDTYRAVKTTEEKSGLDLQATAETTLFQAALQYYAVLAAAEGVRAGLEKVQYNEDELNAVKDMLRSGHATQLDVQTQEQQLRSAENDLLSAQLNLAMVRRNLKKTLRMEEDEPMELDGLLGLQRVPPLSGEEAVKLAFAQRPDYLEQKKAEVAAKYRRKSVVTEGVHGW